MQGRLMNRRSCFKSLLKASNKNYPNSNYSKPKKRPNQAVLIIVRSLRKLFQSNYFTTKSNKTPCLNFSKPISSLLISLRILKSLLLQRQSALLLDCIQAHLCCFLNLAESFRSTLRLLVRRNPIPN